MPTLVVDGAAVHLPARPDAVLLDAVRAAGARVPTLCHHPALEPLGGCRLCLVEITRPAWNGWSKLVVSCLYPVEEGLVVSTASERVVATRRVVLELLLARCPEAPAVRALAREHGVTATPYAPPAEPTDCVLCGRCTRVCDRVGASAIASVDRGIGRVIAPPFTSPPPACTGCLACGRICPTACIPFTDGETSREIWGRSFPLVPCARCGRGFATAEELAGVGAIEPCEPLCDACRRVVTAERMAALAQVSPAPAAAAGGRR
ncbi:MAG TPA: 2Fe-2S iron-sulfur cluster-binding protein [Polyangia bacterium]|jgi:NADH dehydrogenase/NADH:ubiquinone oxidoreductase subunit G